jgi:hypothetical protein
MAVGITQTANPAGGVGTTTVTYSDVAIGVAAPDRYIAVLAGAELTDGYPIAATIDFGAGAFSMSEGTLAGQGVVYSRIFYAPAPAGATATLTVSFGASQGTLTHHIAVYRAVDCVFFAQSAVNDTDADPISSGLVTIPTNGGLLAIASMAADTTTRTWAGATEDIDDDAGTFRFTTAMSTTGGATTLTVSGANTEDGTLAWLVFGPNVGWPLAGNKRRGAAMAAMLATAFIAPPPQPQVGVKFSPALFEVAATADEPPGGYSPKIVSIDDPHPPQRGAQIAPLLDQPVVVDDKIPYRQPSLAYWVPEYVAPQVGAKMAPLLEQQVVAEEKTPYQRPPDVTLHWIPSYVQTQRGSQLAPLLEQQVAAEEKTPYQRAPDVAVHWLPGHVAPQRLVQLTPPPAYVIPGEEHEPPGGSAPKIVSLDDPPLPQVGARIASILYEPPVVVADDPPFRYRRFQWGEGPAVVTEISFGSIVEPVDEPPRFRPFQDTSLWQPGPPEPIVHKKVANTFLHLLIEDNHEPPGFGSPKIVAVDDPPLPQRGAKYPHITVAVVADDPPRLKRSQDRSAWQVQPPLPQVGAKLTPPSVDDPHRRGGFQDTAAWQPPAPLPTLRTKLPVDITNLVVQDNDEPQRLKQSQDRTAWQPPPPLPTLGGKLHPDILENLEPPVVVDEPTGGGWFVTGHLGRPRGGTVTRIVDDGESDDERRQRVFAEILGDLEQVVEEKKPVKVAQAVKAIKRIAKQAPQQTTRSDELIKALRRAEAARAEAERLEQLRIAMAIAHDIERALIAAAMLRHQNEQALIALLLAD